MISFRWSSTLLIPAFAFVCLGPAFAHAFFRMNCNPLTTVRIDPLLEAGKVFRHVHGVAGASGFGPNADFDSLRSSQCSSCEVSQDLSAYWSNTLAFQYSDGSVSFVPQSDKAVYYRPTPDFEPFPKGFSMIAGDSKRTTYDKTNPAHTAVRFVCIGDADTQSVDFIGIPDQKCVGGIRGNVVFPSCWNGRTTSDDHQSHVAYADAGGSCPSGYSRRLPEIEFEAWWGSQAYDDIRDQAKDPQQPFILSTNDSKGFSLHADFQSGWDPDVLGGALDACTMDAHDPRDCPYLDINEGGDCHKSPEVDEVVVRNHALPGPRLAALPGYSTESSASGSNILSNQKTPALCKSPLVWEGAEREFDGCSEASSDGTSDGDNTDGLPRNAPNSGPESSPSSEEVDEDVLSDESSDRENGDKTFSDGLQGYEEESEDDEKVKVDDSAEGKPVLAAGAIWVAFSFLAMTLL